MTIQEKQLIQECEDILFESVKDTQSMVKYLDDYITMLQNSNKKDRKYINDIHREIFELKNKFNKYTMSNKYSADELQKIKRRYGESITSLFKRIEDYELDILDSSRRISKAMEDIAPYQSKLERMMKRRNLIKKAGTIFKKVRF